MTKIDRENPLPRLAGAMEKTMIETPCVECIERILNNFENSRFGLIICSTKQSKKDWDTFKTETLKRGVTMSCQRE